MYMHTHDCISIINVRSSITNITILFTIWHQYELMWVNKVCRGAFRKSMCHINHVGAGLCKAHSNLSDTNKYRFTCTYLHNRQLYYNH